MAELEESGYLYQPHTSAGRVPTDKGFRLYVDGLLEVRPLPPAARQQIEKVLLAEENPEQLLSRASYLLSSLTGELGFVLAPQVSSINLRHIEFIRLNRQKILVIIVSTSGLVQHRVIKVDEDMTQGELDRAGRLLVERFSGRSLLAIRRELLEMMEREKELYDLLLRRAILLASLCLSADENQAAQVYLGSTANLLQKPEFADLEKMGELLRTLEEKAKLVKLISECIDSDRPGVAIRIGSENRLASVRTCSLIASPYAVGDSVAGSLGVLGPVRMRYGRAIPVVEFVAKLVGQLLGNPTRGTL